MHRIRRLFFLTILLGGVAAGWVYRTPIITLYRNHFGTPKVAEEKEVPDPIRYEALIRELEAKRIALAERYAGARTAVEISNVIRDCQETLETTLPEMMRCWLGTPWDYHGTCQKPGSGKIACGYFVSTVLRDAGFRVERFKLAQQPSQRIINTFLPRENIHVRAGLDYERFLKEVISRGPGLRIVGLDKHVAFLVVTESEEVRFIHSSGAPPYCVVDEDRATANSLRNSRYRVTGNLTRNPELIHGWLAGAPWPTYSPPSS